MAAESTIIYIKITKKKDNSQHPGQGKWLKNMVKYVFNSGLAEL